MLSGVLDLGQQQETVGQQRGPFLFLFVGMRAGAWPRWPQGVVFHTPAIQAGGHHRVLVSGAEGEPCRAEARPRGTWTCCGLEQPCQFVC